MGFNLSELTAYVDEQRLPLIGKAVRSAKSAKLFTLQTGVKGTAALNLLNSTAVFGDGSSCGWTPAGETKLSQRNITTGAVKINVPFCDKDLLNYWTGYDVKVAAGDKTLPFEEDFIQSQLDAIAAGIEKAVWQGDTNSGAANLNKFDGLIKVIDAAGSAIDGNPSGAASITTSNVIGLVDDMFALIPAELIDKDNIVIFAGSDTFRKYAMALKNANMYHYNYDVEKGLELVIPGTNVKLVAVNGLNGTDRMFAMQLSNVFYGTDLENDAETFKFWYSEDNSEFRLKVEFVAGVQVAFPDEVVSFDANAQRYVVDFSVDGANGTIGATVDGTAIASGDSVLAGKNVIFTATADSGYEVDEWTLGGSVVGDTSSNYVIVDLGATSTVKVKYVAQ